ncbi:MAG: hypothetical protein OQJ98_00850 [Candidatus Pacebacteria bacterium]|nr:hypothetical protein [Candidatus Paceibacterota bacterium]
MNEDMKKGADKEQVVTSETPQPEVPNTLQDNSPEKSTAGPLVAIIIIIVMLIVGGFYFWKTKIGTLEDANLPTIQQEGEATEGVIDQLKTQGTSDEISAIEEDLSATDLEDLDAELDQILNEL